MSNLITAPRVNIVNVFDEYIYSKLLNIHTVIPGKIVKYDGHATRIATVKPLIKHPTMKGTFISIPEIFKVPVVFPSSSSSSFIFPLVEGDGCLIHFSEVALGNYLDGTVEVDPEDFDKFSMNEAICVPGLWSIPNVPQLGIEDTDTAIVAGDSSMILNDSGITITSSSDVNITNGTSTIEMSGGVVTINGNLEVSA